MLRSRKVTAGKYYVNNARKIIREVLMVNNKTVTFNTYHLDTGNSCGSPSECMILDFIHWADHEATPTEMASLQYLRMEALRRAPEMPNQGELNRIVMEPALGPFVGETTLHLRPP
jgi:hypothetical protein